MKNLHRLIPITALIICACWLFAQRSNLISSRQSISALHARIDAIAKESSNDRPQSWLTASPEKAAASKPDWSKIAREIDYLNAGASKADSSHLERLGLLSEDELAAALEEIKGMPLSRNLRWSLRSLLMTALGKKNPEALLARCDLAVSEDSWAAKETWKSWLAVNPGQSIAWLDDQIRSGNLSLGSTESLHAELEGNLMTYLIKSDPTAAITRLETIDDDLRRSIFRSINLSETGPENYQTIVEIARRGLPENESPDAIACLCRSIPLSATTLSFDSATNFLGLIEATPAERKATVETVAVESSIRQVSSGKMLPRQAVEAMREWATQQSPGSENIATASVVASLQAQGKIPLSEAIEWIDGWYQQSSDDDLIVNFLINIESPDPPDRLKELASRISDPQRRQKILNRYH